MDTPLRRDARFCDNRVIVKTRKEARMAIFSLHLIIGHARTSTTG